MDWEDVKHFLEVADAGSTLAASRRLGVSQTTSARRVAGLESTLGVRLFDRGPAGYALTSDGEALRQRAREAAVALCGFKEQAASLARTIGGVVRVTVVEVLAVTVLAPVFRDLASEHPEISIDLDTSSEPRDLATGAADIAIRSSVNPLRAGLVGRRICDDPWSLYCSRSYAEAHGRPASIAEIRAHPMIGGGGRHIWEPYQKWLEINDLEAAVTMRYSSSVGLLAAVRAGAGLAILPCIVADHDPELLACLPLQAPQGHGIWLLTHERLRHEPRIRTVLDTLAVELKRLSRRRSDMIDHVGGQ
jgi:DNA-binding transcriptional LysR family regulator